jgi:hypothetical protein
VTTLREVALLRLVAQRLAGAPLADAAGAVRWLTAAQAQDYPGALTSIALRTADRTRTGVEKALDDGAVVRSWPMRGTLHFVAADDLGWLLQLCGPRVLAGAAKRRATLGLTEADCERAREVAVTALAGGRRLGRAGLTARFGEGGVATTGQRGYHLLWYLAQTGTLVLGPTDGGEQLFVLSEEWIRAPRRLDREEALRELALRFFRGHGPATVADLARWAGLRITDVRTGLAAARDELTALDVEGTEHWMDPHTPELLERARGKVADVLLLPGFDEFVLGYADRSCALPAEFAERIVPGGNGMFRATVVSGGRIVGTWRWTGRGARRAVAAEPFTTFPDEVAAAIPAAAAALP